MIVDLFGNSAVPTPGGVDTSSGGFNNYATGAKRYGAGRTMPNIGPVSDMLGYAQRDNQAAARKSAIMRRMTGQMTGNPLNPGIANYSSGLNPNGVANGSV